MSHPRKSDVILKEIATNNVDPVSEQKVLPASLSPASTKEKYKMVMLQKDEARMARPVLSAHKYSRVSETNVISDYPQPERASLGKPRRIISSSENHTNNENVAKTAIQNNARRTSGQLKAEREAMLRTRPSQAAFLDCHVNPSKTACVGWASKLVNEFMDKLDNSVQTGSPVIPTPIAITNHTQYLSPNGLTTLTSMALPTSFQREWWGSCLKTSPRHRWTLL